MIKNGVRFATGVAIALVGIVIMLLNIDVVSFGFWRIGGRVDTAVVLLIILAFLIVWSVVSQRVLPNILIGADLLLILVSVLMGTRFMFRRIDAFTLILMVGMIAIGLGLLISALLPEKKSPAKTGTGR